MEIFRASTTQFLNTLSLIILINFHAWEWVAQVFNHYITTWFTPVNVMTTIPRLIINHGLSFPRQGNFEFLIVIYYLTARLLNWLEQIAVIRDTAVIIDIIIVKLLPLYVRGAFLNVLNLIVEYRRATARNFRRF